MPVSQPREGDVVQGLQHAFGRGRHGGALRVANGHALSRFVLVCQLATDDTCEEGQDPQGDAEEAQETTEASVAPEPQGPHRQRGALEPMNAPFRLPVFPRATGRAR